MNKRIRYLAEQAGYEPDVCGIHLDPRIEWFAKYIVEECAEISRKHNIDNTGKSYFIHNIIKEHFGVKPC